MNIFVLHFGLSKKLFEPPLTQGDLNVFLSYRFPFGIKISFLYFPLCNKSIDVTGGRTYNYYTENQKRVSNP
jgi:hypothetical protein